MHVTLPENSQRHVIYRDIFKYPDFLPMRAVRD